ncbi:MAG: GntR family transcriptional regulator [Anaerolineales bacterium]|nr:GntR family transcriptional regulator [Anaerolineales bacterium]
MNKANSIADQAYWKIKKDILTCELEAGAQIVQAQLVERYQMGITPIREALKRIEQEGYLQSIPRYGYLITPITIADVQNIYELRLILEKPSIKLAVIRAPQNALEKIAEMANFTYEFGNRESYLNFLSMNSDFHVSIARASNNKKLADMIARILDEMTRIFNLGLDLRDSGEEMCREHILLSDALLRRDTVLAEQILHDQITRSQERVIEKLSERMSHAPIPGVSNA